MAKPKIFRKRFIPYETTYLKDDEVLFCEDNIIITRWNTLKPRNDIARGLSCYFIEDGFKVSKMYNSKDELVYWYCDIIDTEKHEEAGETAYVFSDLLADIIIYESGTMKIVDIDEIAEAFEDKLINEDLLKKALVRLNNLLQIIYSGNFDTLKKYIEDKEM